jgi:hypothetical protein
MKATKALLLSVLVSVSLLISCEDKNIEPAVELKDTELIIRSIATNEEYNSATDREKEVIDIINSSIAALEGLSLNNKSKNLKYEATFSIDKDGLSGKFDFLAIGIKEDLANARTMSGSCHVCGLRSGIACAKELLKEVDEKGTVSGISITKDGDCYDVKW